MKRGTRKFLFFAFVAIFLVLAPFLVLYTAGYRYNFKNGGFTRTGVISITTIPRGAEILVNNRSISKTSPYVVKQLIPGTYQVELRREGYHPWSGTVDVRSGTTTPIQNILLLQNTPAVQRTIGRGPLLSNPDGATIAYLAEDVTNRQSIVIDSVDGGNAVRIPTAKTVQLISWSANGGHLLYTEDGEQFVISRSGEPIALPEDRSQSSRAFFHPSDDALLYLTDAQSLRQVNLTNGIVTEFTVHVDTVLLDASFLQFIDNGTQVELRQVIDTDSRLIALLPRATYTVVERDGAYLVLSSDNGMLFLVNIHATQPILLEARATMFDWLNNQDLLLYSDGHEVNVYDAKIHAVEFITRQGSTITHLSWHPTGNLILLGSNTVIQALETFRVAKERFVTPLVETEILQTFWTSENGRILYYYAGESLFSQPLTR